MKPPRNGTKLYFAMPEGTDNITGGLHSRPDLGAVQQCCMVDELLAPEKGAFQLRNNRLYVMEIKDITIRLATKEDLITNEKQEEK